MNVEDKFISIAGLICEPNRARLLWNLLDGRAYTATELAAAADISSTSASNHLGKLLEAGLIQVETQGRHRYFAFSSNEVAYAVEALANLAGKTAAATGSRAVAEAGVRHCRTCYDHLAGFVAVRIADALEVRGLIARDGGNYHVTGPGVAFFGDLGLETEVFAKSRRPVARQCLDWSERRPHVAGKLGAAFLERTLALGWFGRIDFSREVVLTTRARAELKRLLGIDDV